METMKPELFVPANPTLFPSMLMGGRRTPAYPPFDSPAVHWFYFARNAIWVAVKMLGLQGREILVPAYHHGVEIEALVDAGAKPVFYRVGPHWDVDLEDVERRLGPNTGAIYLTHYAGFPGPALELKKLAEKHGLRLIEDCAQSLLSSDRDLKLGTVGDVSIFCLYKTLPVPHGGAMVINGPRRYAVPGLPPPPMASTLSHAVSALLQNMEMRGGTVGRWFRSAVRRVGREAVRAGQIERVPTGTMHFNRAHLDLGVSALTLRIAQGLDMKEILERRRRNYFFLLGRLREVSQPLFNELPPGVCPLFYPLAVEDKPAVLQRLWAAGVQVVDLWRDHHPACAPAEFPEVMRLRNSIVEVPCHQDLGPPALTRMAKLVRETLIAVRRSAPKWARG
jgi:perosamine synthetase